MGSFGVTGCHDKAAIKSPGLTVGRSGGSIGVVSYIEEDFWPLNTCLYVRDFHGNNPRFAYYLLQTLDLKALDSGSAQPSLNRNFVHLLPIRFPGREEQDAIASILSAFDDKIDLNRRMNETLEAMARAIFRDWFVDFGPTRAKMEGRPPYLAADLWSLFPDQLDDEGKPEGWSSRPFGSLLTDNIGGDWGTDSPEGENTEAVSIIRGTDLSSLADGYVGKVPTRYTTEKKLSNRKLKSYDIIVEVSGGSPTQPTGRSLLILDSVLGRFSAPVVCASFCRRFRPSSKPEAILAAQHLQHLYSIGGTWEYQNQSTGISNFQTKHFLEKELVVWPAPELAERFFSMVSPLLEAKAKNESLVLSATRDLLLPKLMSGEIRLRDAETLMEKVL
jgi:type I restriction enzyme S subunit